VPGALDRPPQVTENVREDAQRTVPWHALDPAEVSSRLDVDVSRGLEAKEVAERRERWGPNELGHDEPPGNLEILLRQFKSPLIYILLVAAVVTVAIDEYIDTGVIVAVLVLNAAVGFVQERKADRSVRALMELAAPTSRVVRDGREADVDSRELVPGDVVLLESGTRLPADLRLMTTTALQVDESLLTGESVPATKRPEPVAADAGAADRTSMGHMGSVVASGRARGIVVATAAATELGKIAERIRSAEHPESPLTRRMNRFANIIAIVVGSTAVLTFIVGLGVGEAPSEIFLTAVALAVAIVPEGLPVALTVAMALGVRRMAQRNAIIRTLPAVETLGSTNTIGSDKTGTLTQNRMTVEHVWVAGTVYGLEPDALDEGEELLGSDAATADGVDPLSLLLLTGVLTNEADLEHDDEGQPVTRGDPTEAALLVAATRAGLDPAAVRASSPMVVEVPFEPDLRYSVSVREHGDRQVMFVKGAPERILELSRAAAGVDGEEPPSPDAVMAAAHALAEKGLRVLAMAYRPLAEAVDPGAPPQPQDLVFLGLQGMLDPPRHGVKDAVAACNDAGIRVVMITGDHAATATAIAAELGIVTGREAPVLTGRELEGMPEEDLQERVRTVQVYARVSPDHKYRIVEALRANGDVTAVTGDGVNDGPALKASDIGIAMGRSGTDVAREASDMVLADDNFVSIVGAVEEGRVVFSNVRKVTFFLMSTGAAAIVAVLYSLVAGIPLPFLPAQLLWLNVVTNGLQDVALAFEPGEKGVLNRPPRRREEPVVSALLWERTAFTCLTMATGALLLFHWALDGGATVDAARTVALTTMVLAMAFHVYNARSEQRSLFRMNPLGNPFLLASTVGALIIHALALHWGPTQFVLRVEPLDASTWLRMVAVASTVVLVSELHKLLRRER
jgi:magnesium-transporting ATPase (P-type)